MKFGQALDLMVTGKRVSRVNQNYALFLERNDRGQPQKIVRQSKDGKVSNWGCKHVDILADDWVISDF